jgi:5-methylcytosine-specific restriction endonuclease McrA
MNLKPLNDHELIESFSFHIQSERKITNLVLLHINEVESRKLHLSLGFSSMFEYLTRSFGYSESSAYRRIQAARLLKSVPEVSEKLQSGDINLSQASKVAVAVRKVQGASASQLIERIEGQTTKATELIIAKELDLPVQSLEKARAQKDSSVRIEITLSQEELLFIEEAQSLLSHQLDNPKSIKELLVLLANKEVQRKKGLQRKASPLRRKDVSKLKPASMSKTRSRKYISVHKKRRLLEKAQYQCQYENPKTQQRCQCRTHLQIEHIVPVAKGGSDEETNLRIYCSAHNLLAAQNEGLYQSQNYPAG